MPAELRLNPNTNMHHWILDDLRFHLKKSGMTVTELAEILGRSRSNCSNIINGRRRVSDSDAAKLDELWDLNYKFARQLRYARLQRSDRWFDSYIELETEAHIIKAYEIAAIHGLLQTPEYAEALVNAGGVDDAAVLDKRRMDRKAIFERKPPPPPSGY